MDDGVREADLPAELGPALDLVRSLWSEGSVGGLPEHVLAWAMMIEAVDRLTAAHGPTATAGMRERLCDAVRTTPGCGGGTLQ